MLQGRYRDDTRRLLLSTKFPAKCLLLIQSVYFGLFITVNDAIL